MNSKVLIISNANELVRVKPERIVYVESDGNYSTMVLHDKAEYVFTMNLAHCQQMMEEQLGKEAMRRRQSFLDLCDELGRKLNGGVIPQWTDR